MCARGVQHWTLGSLLPLPSVLHCVLPGLLNPARGGDGYRGSLLSWCPTSTTMTMKNSKLREGLGVLEPFPTLLHGFGQ